MTSISIWWFLFIFCIKRHCWCKVLCLINCNHKFCFFDFPNVKTFLYPEIINLFFQIQSLHFLIFCMIRNLRPIWIMCFCFFFCSIIKINFLYCFIIFLYVISCFSLIRYFFVLYTYVNVKSTGCILLSSFEL